MHMGRRAAQKHCRLPRRIATADDDDMRITAITGFHICGGVIDACILERLQPRHRHAFVLHACRHDHGPRAGDDPILQRQVEHAIRLIHGGHAVGHGKAGTEFHGLHLAAPAQVSAGNAGGKAHVILDPAGGASLPANGQVFDDQGAQPFGPGIDTCCDACRAATDDGDVIEPILGHWQAKAHARGDGGGGGVQHLGGAQNDGHVIRAQGANGGAVARAVRAGIVLLDRDAVAPGKGEDFAHAAVRAAADDGEG